MQMCLTGSLKRCSSISAISRRFSVKSHVCARIAESPRTGCERGAASPGHEDARAEQVVFAPSRDHVAEVDQSRKPPVSVGFAAQQKILRDVFSGQDHRRRLQRNQRLGVANRFIQPVEKFWRQSEALMPGAAARDLPGHELSASRLDAGEIADRDALHLRDGLADLRQHALLLVLRQDRPRLTAHHAGQARDDEIRPLVAFAFEHDFRNRDAEPAAQAAPAKSAPTRTGRAASGGKIFRISLSSSPTTRLVPVENTCGSACGNPWLRAISSAAGRHLRRVGTPCLEASRKSAGSAGFGSRSWPRSRRTTGPGSPARTGAAAGCRARRRNPALPARTSCR